MKNELTCQSFIASNPVEPDNIDEWEEEYKTWFQSEPITADYWWDEGERHYSDCNTRCVQFVANGTETDAGVMMGYNDAGSVQTLYILPVKLPAFFYPAEVIYAYATTRLVKLTYMKRMLTSEFAYDAVWSVDGTDQYRHNLLATRATKANVIAYDPANTTGEDWQLYYWIGDAGAGYDLTASRRTSDISLPSAGVNILLYCADIKDGKIYNPLMSLCAVEFALATYPGCANPPAPQALCRMELVSVRYCDHLMRIRQTDFAIPNTSQSAWQRPTRTCCTLYPDDDDCCQWFMQPVGDISSWFPISGYIDDGAVKFLIGYGEVSWDVATETNIFTLKSWPHFNGIDDRTAEPPLENDGGIISMVWDTGTRGGLLPLEIGAPGTDVRPVLATFVESIDSKGFGASPFPVLTEEDNPFNVYFYYQWQVHYWLEKDHRSNYSVNYPSTSEDSTPPTNKDFATVSLFKECTDETDYEGGNFYILDQIGLAQMSSGLVANRSADGKSCDVELYLPANYPKGSTIEIRWSVDEYDTYNIETLWDGMTHRRIDCSGGEGNGNAFYKTLHLESKYQQMVLDDEDGYLYTDGPESSVTAIYNEGTGFLDWHSRNDPLNVFPANNTEVFIKPVVAPPDVTHHEGIVAGDLIQDDSTTFLSTKRALYGSGKLKTLFIPWKNFQVDFLVYTHGLGQEETDTHSLVVDLGGGTAVTLDVLNQTACPGELSVITVILSYDDYGSMTDWYQILDDRVPGLYAFDNVGEEQRVTGCFWEPGDDTVIVRETLVNGLYKWTPVAITPPENGFGIDSGGPRPPFIASGIDAEETLTPFHLKATRIQYRERGYPLDITAPAHEDGDVNPVYAGNRRMRVYGTASGGTFDITYQRTGGDVHTFNGVSVLGAASDISSWLAGLTANDTDGFPGFEAGDLTISGSGFAAEFGYLDFVMGNRLARPGQFAMHQLPITLVASHVVGDPTLTATLTADGLDYDLTIACTEDPMQQFCSGSFYFTASGETSTTLTINASAAEVQAALRAMGSPAIFPTATATGGPLPSTTITISGTTGLSVTSNLTSAFVQFETVPVPVDACGECTKYCAICDRDIPAASFKMTPRNVRRSANTVSWQFGFAWPTWNLMDGYFTLAGTQVDFDYTSATLATDITTAVEAILEGLESGITASVTVAVLDGNDNGGIVITAILTSVNSIEPSTIGITGGDLPIYSGSAITRYKPATLLTCVNDHEFVLYHLNFTPNNGCKYGDMVGDYCMKSGAPFTGTILQIQEGTTYNELSLIIYDTVGASQASWVENLTAKGESVACTNLEMTLDNDGIVTEDTGGYNYGNATIDIESYPLETPPVGGQDITTLPYFDQYLERLRCEWCKNCGEITKELEVMISGVNVNFRKWEEGYDPETPTGWPLWNPNTTLRLHQSAKWCLGDGIGCYWEIEFRGPFQSGQGGLYIDGGIWDGTYVSWFGVFLADGMSLGSGYAGFDVQPGGTTRSTQYFWFSHPYFTLDEYGDREYYSNSNCIGTWAGADYRSDAGWVSNLAEYWPAGGVEGYSKGFYDIEEEEPVVYHDEGGGNWIGPCITIAEVED